MTLQFFITRNPGLIYCLKIHMFCFEFPSFYPPQLLGSLPEKKRATIFAGFELLQTPLDNEMCLWHCLRLFSYR